MTKSELAPNIFNLKIEILASNMHNTELACFKRRNYFLN
jgi:hypothetical protein